MNRFDDESDDRGQPDGAAPAADAALKHALRRIQAQPDQAELAALEARVLAQWRSSRAALQQPAAGLHATPPRAGRLPDGDGAAGAALKRWRRRAWVGTAGLAAAVAIATAIVASRPDPALEELMQPDVLSQLAIGEM